MNIEEVLVKYTNLNTKRREAYESSLELKKEVNQVLFENEEPFELNDFEGNSTGITLKTPHDLQTLTIGMVLSINGTEWMKLPIGWVSCYGSKFTDEQIFVNIMRHRVNTHLIHKAY